MKDKIIKYLKTIEEEKNIKILLACETGSRAWGFPSPDSDYDIRMIYIHKKDWYLSLKEKKDSINLMYEDNDIDITGWELRKALRLLKKSNPPLLERIQSPILYMYDQEFLTEINQISKGVYSKISTIYHYLNMSKKIFLEIENTEKYKLKKLFYTLRTAITCKWIMEKDEISPIDFNIMLENLNLDENIVKNIKELIDLKSKVDESYLHSGENDLFIFIKDILELAELKSKELPAAQFDSEVLDVFLRKMLDKF